jgi:hypothetical protein
MPGTTETSELRIGLQRERMLQVIHQEKEKAIMIDETLGFQIDSSIIKGNDRGARELRILHKDTESVSSWKYTRPMDSVSSSDEGDWAERKESENNTRYAFHLYFINHLSAQKVLLRLL